MRILSYVLLSSLSFSFATEALARIKLITLPVRERVEIQLDHATDTLVEEERLVPLLQGVNQVDFAWTNTHIDADSLLLQVLKPYSDQIEVLSASYPPNENAVVWQLSAKTAGAARIRLSYILHGLTKEFAYVAETAADEKTLVLQQHLRLKNLSNEAFGQAGLWVGFKPYLQRPLGLDETRQLLLGKHDNIPVHKTYTAEVASGYLNAAQKKLRIPMHYVLKNTTAEGLGKAILPAGKVRIYQQDGEGGRAFIGEDWGALTALEADMPLYLGLAQDIVVRRTIKDNKKRKVAGNVYEYTVTIQYEIENFKTTPVILDIIEHPSSIRNTLYGNNGRDVEWSIENSSLGKTPDPELSDFDKLVFHTELPARADGKAQKQTETLKLIFHHGWQ